MTMATIVFITIIICSRVYLGDGLSMNYYDNSCPDAELIVSKVVKEAFTQDKTVAAALLRMHFHDCFIRGCDGSVLLDSAADNQVEKVGPPNQSLHAFFVIDSAKKAIEAACPGVVSCADILAFSARDSVVLAGGPTWDVPKGRKDGRISLASETRQLPAPTFNLSQLQQNFAKRGLDLGDLVALSGGHSLGFSHCSSFQNRLHNFDATNDVDPSMNPSFAASLQKVCPAHNKLKTAGSNMDPSPVTFDNSYYKLMLQRKTLFTSDQALLAAPSTKSLVYKYASSNKAFYDGFVKSMIKMSSLTGGQEVRKNCRKVNLETSDIENKQNY